MRKRFTKIICAALAAISVISLAALPACKKKKWNSSAEMDDCGKVYSNGGFVVQTGGNGGNDGYVYFINGVASSKDSNVFGEVVKGSVQRIKKTDLANRNYSSTQTIVPSVVYSGSYSGGIYIYGDYIYYTTPTDEKNLDGEVQNSTLDFKRTKLDGSDTTDGYLFRSENNSIEYRFVEVNNTVYVMYAVSENLFEDNGVTNIHSVNCDNGEDTILAYNVSSYSFDTEDPENPYAYYTTQNVMQDIGDSGSVLAYNQLYRVRADATESPRDYDFSSVKDYDKDSKPTYINHGYHVFDGIGHVSYANNGYKLNQFNYGYGSDESYNLTNSDYVYSVQSYKNGQLFYTRKEVRGTNSDTSLYKITDEKLGYGKGIEDWDAIKQNELQSPFLRKNSTTNYVFMTIDGVEYAISGSASGIIRQPVEDGEFGEQTRMCTHASANIIITDYENGYIYYTYSDGLYRLEVDGTYDDYVKLTVDEEAKVRYSPVKILDVYVNAAWYKPEFVGNTLLFASEIGNMSKFDYIVACDLSGENGIMTNQEIIDLNEKRNAVLERIDEYAGDEDDDMELAQDFLRYLFYTRDGDYLEELIKAYKDVEDKDDVYTQAEIDLYNDYVKVSGDWAKNKDGEEYSYKKVNGEDVAEIFNDYYYSVLGKMSEEDEKGLKDAYRGDYMKAYPEKEEITWWQGLSKGAKAAFIIGMVAIGLIVIAGATVLVIFIVKKKKNGMLGASDEKASKVDITDDKNLNVYGDEEDKQ